MSSYYMHRRMEPVIQECELKSRVGVFPVKDFSQRNLFDKKEFDQLSRISIPESGYDSEKSFLSRSTSTVNCQNYDLNGKLSCADTVSLNLRILEGRCEVDVRQAVLAKVKNVEPIVIVTPERIAPVSYEPKGRKFDKLMSSISALNQESGNFHTFEKERQSYRIENPLPIDRVDPIADRQFGEEFGPHSFCDKYTRLLCDDVPRKQKEEVKLWEAESKLGHMEMKEDGYEFRNYTPPTRAEVKEDAKEYILQLEEYKKKERKKIINRIGAKLGFKESNWSSRVIEEISIAVDRGEIPEVIKNRILRKRFNESLQMEKESIRSEKEKTKVENYRRPQQDTVIQSNDNTWKLFGWKLPRFGGGPNSEEKENTQKKSPKKSPDLFDMVHTRVGQMCFLDQKDIDYTQNGQQMTQDGVFHYLKKIVGEFNTGKNDSNSVVLMHPDFVDHFLNFKLVNQKRKSNGEKPFSEKEIVKMYASHEDQPVRPNRAIVPVLRGEHFFLLHIGRDEKSEVHVHIMDSVFSERLLSDKEAKAIGSKLFAVKAKNVTVARATEATIQRQKNNNFDCGPHTIVNAEACLRDEAFNPNLQQLSVMSPHESIEHARLRIIKTLNSILENETYPVQTSTQAIEPTLASEITTKTLETSVVTDNDVQKLGGTLRSNSGKRSKASSLEMETGQSHRESSPYQTLKRRKEEICDKIISRHSENVSMTRSQNPSDDTKSEKKETMQKNVKQKPLLIPVLQTITDVPTDVPQIDISDAEIIASDAPMDLAESPAFATDCLIDVSRLTAPNRPIAFFDDPLDSADALYGTLHVPIDVAPTLESVSPIVVPLDVTNSSTAVSGISTQQNQSYWNCVFDEDIDSIRMSEEKLTNQALFMLMHQIVESNNTTEGKEHVALIHVEYSHQLDNHWNDRNRDDPNITEYMYFDRKGTKKYIIPLLRHDHFTVLFLDKSSQAINYLDSTFQFQHTDQEIKVIAKELGVLNPKILKIGEYGKGETLPQTVKQTVINSCGVFCINYCELLCNSGTSWVLKELNVTKKRREMLVNIMDYIELGKAVLTPLARDNQKSNTSQLSTSITDDFDFETFSSNIGQPETTAPQLQDMEFLEKLNVRRSKKGKFVKINSNVYGDLYEDNFGKRCKNEITEDSKSDDSPNAMLNSMKFGVEKALLSVKDRNTLKTLKRIKGCLDTSNANCSSNSTPVQSSDEYEPPALHHSKKLLSPKRKKELVKRYRDGCNITTLIKSFGLPKDEKMARQQIFRLCQEVEGNKSNKRYKEYLLKERVVKMTKLIDEVEMEEIHEMDIQRLGIEQSRVFGLNSFQGSRCWIKGVKDELGLVSRHIDKRVTSPLTTPGPTVEEKVRRFKRDQVERIKRRYPPSKIFNVDQTGVKYENCRNRTLTKKGSRFVARTAQRLNALTHSFTVNPCISATGRLVGRTFVTLREQRAPRSFRRMVAPFSRRLLVTQTKSGMMTKRLAIKWFLKCFLPKIPDGSLLFLDSWNGFKDMMKLSAARRKNLEFVVIPPKTTSHLQPLDLVFNRQFKSFLKTLEGLIRSRERHLIISVRAIRVSIIQFTMNQFKAKRFRGMIQKGFEELGVIGTYKKYVTPTKYCLHPKQTAGHGCQTNGCRRGALVKCGYCDKLMCITCALKHLHGTR